NKRNEADDVAVLPNAERQYKDLLDLLSRLRVAARKDLNTPEFKRVFRGDRVLRVTSAKHKVDAVAASDGAYWWLIYPGGGDRHPRVLALKLSACNTLDEASR